MSEPPSKRRRVELTLDDRIKLIREYESVPKPSMKALSEKFGIGKSTVGDILKKKDLYKNQWENNASPSRIRIGSEAKYDKLNELVWEWFCVIRAKNLPLSGPIIQEKALTFAKELGFQDFKASNGWLGKWKARYNVREFKVSGESAGVNMEDVDDFKSRIPEFVGTYENKDLFNCDETGLYYRALPDKTLSAKGSSTKGTKVSKERVTVMFACSATGEKLKPLVIGKAKNPRCFKNVKTENLKVDYYANKKAWMNNGVFKQWLSDLNKDMHRQGRHIMLMLDNAASHGKEDDYNLSNVRVKFLPANTTSKLQPLDQGVIRAFKAHYRRYLLKSLISSMDSSDSVEELCKNVNLLDAINWIVKAWGDVKCETIVKCFSNVGFNCDVHVSDECDDEFDDDDVPLAVLVREFQCSLADFEEVDNDIPTEDTSDEWELNMISSFCDDCNDVENVECSDDECDIDNECSLPGSEMTHSEALQTLVKLKNFALEKDIELLDKILELKSLTESKIVKLRCTQKQTTINDFFKKQ